MAPKRSAEREKLSSPKRAIISRLYKPSLSAKYCTSEAKQPEDEKLIEFDLTKPDYGLEGVKLDTEAFSKAFGSQQHFERPHELAWMLWQPPSSVMRPEEWESMHYEQGCGEGLGKMARAMGREQWIEAGTMIAVPHHIRNLTGIGDMYMNVVEHINSGDIEPLKQALSPALFEYVKGWLAYMKANGLTWEHKVHSVSLESRTGEALLVERGELKEENDLLEMIYLKTLLTASGDNPNRAKLSPKKAYYKETTPYWNTFYPKASDAGPHQTAQNLSYVQWVHITSSESYQIRDKNGTIKSSPPTDVHHFLKWGAESFIVGDAFSRLKLRVSSPNDPPKYKRTILDTSFRSSPEKHLKGLPIEELDTQWQVKFLDFDNQVALRFRDILTKEKLFFSPNTSPSLIWSSTKVF